MSSRRRPALVGAVLLALSGCSSDECGPARAKVNRVLDGDTVELENGERVRYLGVDTPEIGEGRADCYGVEAYEFNRTLVEGREVELHFDRQCKDHFQRLLAYVLVDSREVNALLVERGYACTLHIPPNGAARAAELSALQQQAQSAGRGLWGYCDDGCP